MRLGAVTLTIVVGSVFGSACSNTLAVGRLDRFAPEEATARVKELIAEHGDNPASVTSVVPEVPDMTVDTGYGALSVADERTFLLKVPQQEDVRIPFESTQQIVFRNRGAGALGGAAMGVAGGALAGIAVSLVYNFWESADCTLNSPWGDDSSYTKPSSCSSRIERGRSAMVGAVIGTAVGAIIGAAIGHRTYVTF